jgi:hypothetical protein
VQQWGAEKLAQTYSAASSYLPSWVSSRIVPSSEEHTAPEPVAVSQAKVNDAPVVVEPVVPMKPVIVITDEIRLAASIKAVISEFMRKEYHEEKLAEFMQKDLTAIPQKNFWNDSRELILAALPRGKTDNGTQLNLVCGSREGVAAFREALKAADPKFAALSQPLEVVVDVPLVVASMPPLQQKPIVPVESAIAHVDDEHVEEAASFVEDDQQDNDEFQDAYDEDQSETLSQNLPESYQMFDARLSL